MEPALQGVTRRIESTIRIGRCRRSRRGKQSAEQRHCIRNVDVSVVSDICRIETVHRFCQKQETQSPYGISNIDNTIRIRITTNEHAPLW